MTCLIACYEDNRFQKICNRLSCVLRDIGLQSFHIALHYCCIQRRIMTAAKRNRVTLADVAKAANVSRSTASRALNNSPRISRETTARIKKIADSVGFIPNAQGRALAVGAMRPSPSSLPSRSTSFSTIRPMRCLSAASRRNLANRHIYRYYCRHPPISNVIVCNNIWNDAHSTRLSTFPPTPTTICWRKCTKLRIPLRNAWPDGGSLI